VFAVRDTDQSEIVYMSYYCFSVHILFKQNIQIKSNNKCHHILLKVFCKFVRKGLARD